MEMPSTRSSPPSPTPEWSPSPAKLPIWEIWPRKPGNFLRGLRCQRKHRDFARRQKEADEYFARDAARPTIFRINQDLYKKLSETSTPCATKNSSTLDSANITRAEIHNRSGTILCTRKTESEWVSDATGQQNDKQQPTDKKPRRRAGKIPVLDKLLLHSSKPPPMKSSSLPRPSCSPN